MRHQAQLLQCTLSSSNSDQILDNLTLWSNLATLEYPATQLHTSERFVEWGQWKQKDLFSFIVMQISGPVIPSN